ncbi:MAG: hypothetical protein DHS20C01_25460 [marine bacterium B5-7]|nr:MAG: hypothetical protein DHS20C01_25460 [marine bacterium B5-7]
MAIFLGTHGIRVRARSQLQSLGFILSVAQLAQGVSVADGLALLAAEFPEVVADANHRYQLEGAGRVYAHTQMGFDDQKPCETHATIGMIDTLVDVDDPLLKDSQIEVIDVLPAGVARAESTHGTAVAAILTGADKDGFVSVAPRSQIISVAAFRLKGDSNADTTVQWIVTGMDRLVEREVDVINVSLGGAPNRLLEMTMKRLDQLGVAVVAAAGNGGPQAAAVYPAAYDSVIAVTAIDANQKLFRDANIGDYVDFSAPGVDVFVPTQIGRHYVSGTSYAAPFITAAIAAARTMHSPTTPRELVGRLAAVSEDLGAAGFDPLYGWGLPNMSALCE